MKYKYEFEADKDFEPGQCYECPFHYEEWYDDGDNGTDNFKVCCIERVSWPKKCPLKECTE